MPPIGYDNGASSNVFLVDQYQNYEKARENGGYFGLGWPGSCKPWNLGEACRGLLAIYSTINDQWF